MPYRIASITTTAGSAGGEPEMVTYTGEGVGRKN